MRFIPYIGTWIILGLPFLFSVATSEGWLQPLELVTLFLILELVTANLFEPLFFGMSIGVSPLFLLVAAIFWGWLWGPIGFLLSTPMTVCLYVLGRYVPHLEFLEVLLGEEPVLDGSINYYQRLLARDHDEAAEVIEQALEKQSLDQVFDTVFLPALILTRQDRERGELEEADVQYILKSTRRLINDLSYLEPGSDAGPPPPSTASSEITILICPAQDEIDETAALMFQRMVERARIRVEIASTTMLASEVMTKIEEEHLALIFIASLPPGGLAQTRYLCKRLRARFPSLRIAVGRWGIMEDVDAVRERLQLAGANLVETTLSEARGQVVPLAQSLAHVEELNPSAEPVANHSANNQAAASTERGDG
jgi:hypothetical protein